MGRRFACMALGLAALAWGAGPVPARARAARYVGVGVVRGIEAGGRVLVIRHGAIPGLMDAMTMPFEVSSPALTKGLKPGDRIRFTFVHQGDFWPVVAVRKLGPPRRRGSSTVRAAGAPADVSAGAKP